MPIRIAEGKQEDGEHFESLIQRARQAFLGGDIKEAKKLFQEASLIDANHPEVCHGLGAIALREGRYKDAIAFLRRAVEKNPNFSEAWNNLGFAYFKKGRYTEAQKAFERAVELDPEEREYQNNLRNLLSRNKPRSGGNSKKLSLSLCMIVRDEAENLKKYLSRFCDFFDDVVVVDTGSVDDTLEVASSLGARVFNIPWENDFSRARNESLRRAKGDWILVLDADEAVDKEGIKRLREVAAKTPALGLQLPIYNYNAEEKVGVVNFALRFFRKNPAIRFKGRVHETVEESIVALGGAIGRIDVPIHHFGYTSPEEVRRKNLERNFPIIEEIFREDPDNLQAALYYAKTKLIVLGEKEEAKKALLHIVGRPEWRGKPAYIEALFYLGQLFFMEGNLKIAERLWERVHRYDPYLPDALFALGNLAFEREDYCKALNLWEEILQLEVGKSKTNLLKFAFTDEVLYERLLRSAIFTEEWEKAMQYGEKMRKLKPDDANVLHNLALAYFQGGHYEDAEILWRETLSRDPQHPEARSLLFYLYTVTGRPEEARSVLEEVERVF